MAHCPQKVIKTMRCQENLVKKEKQETKQPHQYEIAVHSVKGKCAVCHWNKTLSFTKKGGMLGTVCSSCRDAFAKFQ